MEKVLIKVIKVDNENDKILEGEEVLAELSEDGNECYVDDELSHIQVKISKGNFEIISDNSIPNPANCPFKLVGIVQTKGLGNLKIWVWEPKQDITAFEFSCCLPILFTAGRGIKLLETDFDYLGIAKRHFTFKDNEGINSAKIKET
jgi:hypothetical protein